MHILSKNFISFTAQIYIMHCICKAKKGDFGILGGMAPFLPLNPPMFVLVRYLVRSMHIIVSGVFRGATVRCPPPLWPDHENFLQAILYEKVRFCHFSARIAKFNYV